MNRKWIHGAVVALLIATAGSRGQSTQPAQIVLDLPQVDNVTVDGDAADWGDRGLRYDVLTEAVARSSASSSAQRAAFIDSNRAPALRATILSTIASSCGGTPAVAADSGGTGVLTRRVSNFVRSGSLCGGVPLTR